MIPSPVSCTKRNLLCLNIHIVRMTKTNKDINIRILTLSNLCVALTFSSKRFSKVSPGSAASNRPGRSSKSQIIMQFLWIMFMFVAIFTPPLSGSLRKYFPTTALRDKNTGTCHSHSFDVAGSHFTECLK